MKLNVLLLGTILTLGISSLFHAGPLVHAGIKNDEPDKVITVDVDPDKTNDPDFCNTEELEANKKLWDMSKQIEVTYGNLCFFAFLSNDGTESWIYEVRQLEPAALSILEFPDMIEDAPVTKLGPETNYSGSDWMVNIWGFNVEPYHGADCYDKIPHGITQVSIPSTVNEIVFATFCGFRDLTSVRIPDGVKTLGYAVFYNCINLKEVVFPADLENFQFMTFKKCKNLDTISISKSAKNYSIKNGMMFSKNGKTLVWVQPKINKITIPEGVTKLGQGATIYSNVKYISIPKSVTSIKEESLNGNKIKSITISSKNSRYAKSGNCIYSKKTKRLVAGISTDGTLTLAKEVLYLKNNVSIAGKALTELTIPESFKGFEESCWRNSKYSNLRIVIFKSKTPPVAVKDSFRSFSTYVVPKGSLKTYKEWYETTDEVQNEYDSYIEFSEK